MTDHCIPSQDTAEHHRPFHSHVVLGHSQLSFTSLRSAGHLTAPFPRSRYTSPFPGCKAVLCSRVPLLIPTAATLQFTTLPHIPVWGRLRAGVKKSSVQSCTELGGQRGPHLQAGLVKGKGSSWLPFCDKASVHYQLATPESPAGLLTDLCWSCKICPCFPPHTKYEHTCTYTHTNIHIQLISWLGFFFLHACGLSRVRTFPKLLYYQFWKCPCPSLSNILNTRVQQHSAGT